MLNCSLFAVNPAGHHCFNVAVHALTAVLLFLLLKDGFGSLWSGAWVAAVFAIHPLHVESVAWISELKDVLMGLFFVLTLLTYFRYARKPFSVGRYSLVVLCYILGLLSKPMLVTLPFLLLLLDYWPLKRFSKDSPSRAPVRMLIVEKIPFLVLAAASCIATLIAQRGVFTTPEAFTLPLRVENALLSYAIYFWQTILPLLLSPFYPFPEVLAPSWRTLLVLCSLVGLTALVIRLRLQRPWLLVGWFWFLGMLIPVIGLVQVGYQAHADRYLYLPQIGLLLMFAFLGRDLRNLAPGSMKLGVTSMAVASIAALTMLARAQASHWHDSEALWTQAIRCDSHNARACLQLGSALAKEGRVAEATIQCQRALELRPSAEAHANLAAMLQLSRNFQEAHRHYRLASLLEPANAVLFLNWGALLAQHGDLPGALNIYHQALAMYPRNAEIHLNIGQVLGRQNRLDEALREFRQALDLQPDNFRALVGFHETARRLDKEEQAIPFLKRACAVPSEELPQLLCRLAEAYARTGKSEAAMETVREALAAAESNGNPALKRSIQEWSKAFPMPASR